MRKPKKGPSATTVMKDLTPDFFDKFQERLVRDWVNQANNNMWNWEECSYRASQAELTPNMAWRCVKFSRYAVGRQSIPLRDTKGKSFSYHIPFSVQRLLHFID